MIFFALFYKTQSCSAVVTLGTPRCAIVGNSFGSVVALEFIHELKLEPLAFVASSHQGPTVRLAEAAGICDGALQHAPGYGCFGSHTTTP